MRVQFKAFGVALLTLCFLTRAIELDVNDEGTNITGKIILYRPS